MYANYILALAYIFPVYSYISFLWIWLENYTDAGNGSQKSSLASDITMHYLPIKNRKQPMNNTCILMS